MMCSGRKKDQMMEIIIVEDRAFLLCSECGWNRETEISDGLREELKKAGGVNTRGVELAAWGWAPRVTQTRSVSYRFISHIPLVSFEYIH
jgi:hypothetical protein